MIDVIAELDMSSFFTAYRLDGRGGAAYDPQMMLALMVYAYCVDERSSRRIERRLFEDVRSGLAQAVASRSLRSGGRQSQVSCGDQFSASWSRPASPRHLLPEPSSPLASGRTTI